MDLFVLFFAGLVLIIFTTLYELNDDRRWLIGMIVSIIMMTAVIVYKVM